MRFMLLMIPKGYENAAPGAMPDAKAVGAMMTFNDSLQKAGVLLTLDGYWMIQVKSKEEAIAWASRCPASDNEVIEVRQVQEFSDFPPDVREAAAGFPELQARSNPRE